MHHKSWRRGFTLIELLVVIAIIAILAVVVVLTLNPAELLRQSRDSNRVSDMATISNALGLYTEDVGGNIGSSNVVYLSLPDSAATTTIGTNCSTIGLITLPSIYSYHCGASSTYRAVNGNGWVPVNFSLISSGAPFGDLPVDPINVSSSRFYYTYTVSGTNYELTSAMESEAYGFGGSKDVISPDGGALTSVYEKGTTFGLEPLDSDDSSLIAYYSFNEGTGTVAYDYSGNNANGNWAGTKAGTSGYYSVGKIGPYAGYFNGIDDRVVLPSLFANSGVCNATISAWSEDLGTGTGSMGGIIEGTSNGWDNIEYNDTSLRFELRNTLGGNSDTISGSYLNKWIFTALVLSSGNVYGYINGAQVWSGGNIGCIGLTTWTMGAWDTYFDGLIDDARVYNRALTSAQIAAMYANGK